MGVRKAQAFLVLLEWYANQPATAETRERCMYAYAYCRGVQDTAGEGQGFDARFDERLEKIAQTLGLDKPSHDVKL